MANLVLEPLEREAAAVPELLRHLLRLVDAVHLLPLELLQRGRCSVDTSASKSYIRSKSEGS